jgi:hypothetical protein
MEVNPMLTDRPIHTPLPATDLERARRFYAEKLGLTPETELLDTRMACFTVVVTVMLCCAQHLVANRNIPFVELTLSEKNLLSMTSLHKLSNPFESCFKFRSIKSSQ